jgi:hypothetical protein
LGLCVGLGFGFLVGFGPAIPLANHKNRDDLAAAAAVAAIAAAPAAPAATPATIGPATAPPTTKNSQFKIYINKQSYSQ